jgi:uncharacterized membrane protein (DUF2068 family)
MREPVPPSPSAVGLRVIIAYKAVKGALQAVLAVTLPVLRRLGITDRLAAFTTALAEHAVHGWAAVLARLLATLLTPDHVTLIALALGFDALLSWFEGWALHRRFRWAPWLVVIAGGSLVPYEVYELARRVRVGRALILVINLVIIAYLARRAAREHAERRHPHLPAADPAAGP